MSQSMKFWDRIAKRYSKTPVKNEATYQKKLQITRDYLEPAMTVLEFGCGTGSTALVHAPYVKQIRAIDGSAKMLEFANSKAAAGQIENVRFEKATIEEFAAPDQSFDAVLGLSILHLLEDKEAAIAKVYNMLKPGGFFVSSTVCLGDRMKFFKLILPIGRFFGLLPLLKFFAKDELEKNLTDAGFDIDYNWQPDTGDSVFIVAKKPA